MSTLPTSPSSPSSTTSAAMPAPSTTPSARQRKKPGPKPKPKPVQSLIVVLKVPSTFLATLPASPMGEVTPSASSPRGTSPQPNTGEKRKGVPGPKPGTKRVRAPGAPPLKPGRKKTKLDPTQLIGPNGLKLGPKANTGAINDKLRALDRTGKPCKRWQKSGFTLKSFTGVTWAVPAWSAPRGGTESASEDAGSANVSTVDPGEKMVIDSYGPIATHASAPHTSNPAPQHEIPTVNVVQQGITA
ncbi:INO80 complex subunit Ies4-domain-containing protein [Pyronema domesticum]|uniref:Similar to Uncharacterized protein C23G3.04 acc. no. Q9P7S9 n=1 Tax=Pyronema omphalodes (strain CBS 100304) TaxID=1076935 RepID=U4KUG9_PYROM|nr:INO80 complex subunit Ies4-domain-containing protein [Pyronema domesticum]CCX04682.1 Similar to Uncharacterized protein C23G3.04; acc. no. Q9P7S9 [Pyronema omphalodes CBS 100304]